MTLADPRSAHVQMALAHILHETAKQEVERIRQTVQLPLGTTISVILVNAPAHGSYTHGKHWKEVSEPVIQALHENIKNL